MLNNTECCYNIAQWSNGPDSLAEQKWLAVCIVRPVGQTAKTPPNYAPVPSQHFQAQEC